MAKINNQTKENFRRASRTYSDTSVMMHESIARKVGLNGVDHKYLSIIMQHGEMTAGELAKLTGLTTGAVTGLIDRLEKKKLVQRKYDVNDRRKVLIVPNKTQTDKLLTPVFAQLIERTDKLYASFTEAELKTVERYFTMATDVMNGMVEYLNNKKK
ncbi:MAG: MarR family transcriptional regulator [Sphingobacteriales bacterium]|nr:MAG: MarR family transcriptional regulator [Sphingobacteriales bacterium]